MNCKNHLNQEGLYSCLSCGQPVCLDCTVALGGKVYCKECLENHIVNKPLEVKSYKSKRKSKFLTFLLSFVPGAGHMYLGLINKGFTLMILFFGSLFITLFLSNTLNLHWLPGVLIPALCILSVFYSMFDSLAAADAVNSGKIIKDESPVELSVIKDIIISRKNTIGYVLIVTGLIGLLSKMEDMLNSVLRIFFRQGLPFSFTGMMVPFLLIFLGFYLIRKSQRV